MPKNVITLETAQAWADRFNKDRAIMTGVKAFTIPGSNVREVMVEGVIDVRAYFGINDESEATLMIVGVDKDGNDLIDEGHGFYIYDFSRPCPNSCNKKEPFINSLK